MFLVLLITLSATLAAACSTAPAQSPAPSATALASTPALTPSDNATSGTPLSSLPSVADIVEQVEPSVVYISVEYVESSFFFQTVRTKTGSGVMLSPEGYIMTNNHVIEDARSVEVVLPNDPTTYEAEIVGMDPFTDLAVIKIEGRDFPSVRFADTSRLRIGDWVIAIGNALGLEGGPSVTVGIVSNLDRSVALGESRNYDIIQTDAAINQGNSGGPLVDLAGNVVGINTFIISTAENIGFAINASTASRVYDDVVRTGRVTNPYLGVRLQTMTPAVASSLDLARDRGVLVAFVESGSPSDIAGLEVNDVITRFQGQEVDDAAQVIKLLWHFRVGDNVAITYWRGAEQRDTTVTLAERPEGS